MASPSLAQISEKGLWSNNPALVQILGLCPLLAVSGSVVNGLGMGLATIFVLVMSNTTVSLIRNFVPDEIRVPIFVLVIAAFVTAIELLMNAFTYELYLNLGIFIPLIVTNCTILARAEGFASKNKLLPSFIDGLMQGLGFALVLVLLGAIREILGAGTLFDGMDLLLGEFAADWKMSVFGADYPGFLFAILPPGAFLGLGFLIAGKNWLDQKRKQKQARAELFNTEPQVVEVK
ncbi:electron transport complex subunit E [Pelagibaculum spongiae]|uniref:Ion-translocating oxidoreductase complex subunit E n=1 Tax=Pelagibaculum spongiae TaxID=2080658 RepID=A0A2V1GP50_9GAMM|nr:electron transport complex subunit E [Pelagibaculum spongiae]PVZ64345.1 electron transport complex subunit RsxE [Pelagibaculum spongiae]